MARRCARIVLAAVLIILPACRSKGFVRPGASEQEFWRDLNACEAQVQPKWRFCGGFSCLEQDAQIRGWRNRCMFARGWHLSRDGDAFRP
jgi:hypothetical protein